MCTLYARIKYRELISFHCSTYSERLFQPLTNILHIHRHMKTEIYSQHNSFLWFWRNTIQFPSISSFTHTKCYYKLNFNPLHVKFTSGKKPFHLCTYHAYVCLCVCGWNQSVSGEIWIVNGLLHLHRNEIKIITTQPCWTRLVERIMCAQYT